MVLQAMCGLSMAEQKNPGRNKAILLLRVAFLSKSLMRASAKEYAL
jgi:hypothetical protein